MDCGEGTYGQLVRLLGISESDQVLRKLTAVYISHLHADHHIGFIRLLQARRRAFQQVGVDNVSFIIEIYEVKGFPLLLPFNLISYSFTF